MSVVDLLSLSPEDITKLCAAAPKRGYITPAIDAHVASGNIAANMDEMIEWPTNDEGTAKTLAQKVQALKQNIENHQTKVLKGKAIKWPNLVAVPVNNNGSSYPMLVNQDALEAAKKEAAKVAEAK